jgi:hypothetical protein
MIVNMQWQIDMIFNFYSFGASLNLQSFIFQVLHGFIYPLSRNKPMKIGMLIGSSCFRADKTCLISRGLIDSDV